MISHRTVRNRDNHQQPPEQRQHQLLPQQQQQHQLPSQVKNQEVESIIWVNPHFMAFRPNHLFFVFKEICLDAY